MNKMTVSDGMRKWELLIDRVKFIVGSNQKERHQIHQALRLLQSKSESEWRKETHSEASLLIDDEQLALKKVNFFEVNLNFSIVEDCKMTAKSLIQRYLEIKLGNSEIQETVNTLEILFQALAEEVSDEDVIKLIFDGINGRSLLKLMKPYYIEEYQKDEFDLTYDELILLQLKLIQYIIDAEVSKEKNLVIMQIPMLTESLVERIYKMNHCLVIAFTDEITENMHMDDLYIVEQDKVDAADVESLFYEIENKTGRLYSLEELKTIMEKCIREQYAQRTFDLIHTITHTSSE